jgi:outer membrane protein TolC
MNRQLFYRSIVWSGLLLALATGCQPQEPFYFFDDGDLSHYVGVASNLDVPDVDLESLDEVEGALPPLTLSNFKPESIDDLSLEEAVRIALENSKVMRNLGGVAFGPTGAQGSPSTLLSNPGAAATTLDPAITETDPRFGIESALSAFDARFSTSAFWEKNDSPVNTRFSSSIFSQVNQQDLGTFQARLAKTNATGGTTALTHNVRYEQSNSPLRDPIWSDWSTNIEAEFRQPLMQGFGVQYNRIAGPGAIPGFNAGVMIARLRADTSLADFEAGVRNLVSDVERAYWNLYFAYRHLDAVTKGRDATLQTWRQVYAKWEVGGEGGGTQNEAQARQQYFQFRAAVEEAQSNLYKTENILRYIMGLAATDGRLFRPSDEPTTAKANFDWYESYAESLVRSVELRRQRWVVKQADLALIAAKNYLLPRVDVVGRYRWLGMGDKLINQSDIPFIGPAEGSNAYGSMTDGDFQEWQIGVEAQVPLGFRKEMSGVRNAQLTLVRERAVLQEQELELQHQLQDSFRDLDKHYRLSETNFNRHEAAAREVQAVNAGYEGGTATLDLLLDAQRRMAEAENDYYRSLVDYNLAITEVHLRKGSLLEYNGVILAEGPWPAKAYFDAKRRAQARDASFYFDYGFTRPKVISRGPYAQHAGEQETIIESGSDVPEGMKFELVPTPAPVPIDREPSGPGSPQASRGGAEGYDLGAHLDLLVAKPQSTKPQSTGPQSTGPKPAAGTTPVKKAEFVEANSPGGEKAAPVKEAGQWKSKRRSGPSHESHANLSTSEARGAASGWKGTQR